MTKESKFENMVFHWSFIVCIVLFLCLHWFSTLGKPLQPSKHDIINHFLPEFFKLKDGNDKFTFVWGLVVAPHGVVGQ